MQPLGNIPENTTINLPPHTSIREYLWEPSPSLQLEKATDIQASQLEKDMEIPDSLPTNHIGKDLVESRKLLSRFDKFYSRRDQEGEVSRDTEAPAD